MTTEIPNNAPVEEIMDFKKFAQSVKKLIYSEENIWIEGTFKEVGNKKIITGDNFWAKMVHSFGKPINQKEIYQSYIEWFNYTLRPFEKKRVFVSAKFLIKKTGFEKLKGGKK